jgi:AraC-like DNA-binding protein
MNRMPKANRSTNSLAAGIAALAREEGCNSTRYAGAAVFRITAPEAPTATFYPAALILVGAGEKQGTQMLQAGGRVKAVAHDVGYESESQFSREYRRFFGVPPSGEGTRTQPAPRDENDHARYV